MKERSKYPLKFLSNDAHIFSIFIKYVSVIFLIISLFFSLSTTAQVHLEKRWVTEGLKVPESVYVYKDSKSNYLFVSQIDGQAGAADGVGEIGKMTVNGNLFAADWVTGLNAPKGMGVYDDKLYVADLDKLVVINIKKGEIEKSYHIEGATFLNDVVIDKKGAVYVSDTRVNKIYKVQNDKVEIYLENVENANGLALVGNNLIVGAGTHLLLFDEKKNRLPIANGFAQAIDGVVPLAKGDFLVSCWAGLIYYVRLNGHLELLLDVQKDKINTADIAYDPESKLVYVPNFSKNTVSAYELKME